MHLLLDWIFKKKKLHPQVTFSNYVQIIQLLKVQNSTGWASCHFQCKFWRIGFNTFWWHCHAREKLIIQPNYCWTRVHPQNGLNQCKSLSLYEKYLKNRKKTKLGILWSSLERIHLNTFKCPKSEPFLFLKKKKRERKKENQRYHFDGWLL